MSTEGIWMVWDSEEQLVCFTDDYEKAVLEYGECVERARYYARANGLSDDLSEKVILAKVVRQTFPVEKSDGFHWLEERDSKLINM